MRVRSASATATAGASSDTELFNIIVNNVDRAPVVIAPATVGGVELSPVTLASTASDADGDAITSLTMAPLPAGATFTPNGSNTAGTFSWTPGANDAGTYPLTTTASNLLSGSALTTLTIAGQNAAPSFTDPADNMTVAEGASASQTIAASDPDAGTDLAFTLTNNPAFVSLTDDGATSATITATPGFNDAGNYLGLAAHASDGIVTIDSFFDVFVTNTNRPVTLDPIADVNVAEGASDTRTLVANDPDGDAITYSASLPAFASLAGNVITVSPGFTDAGSYPASATATSADLTSDTENFTINVSNTNRPVTLDPIADVNIGEGASDTRTLVANDPDGDAIRYSASLPAFASLAGNVITVSPGFTDAGSYPASATATSADLTSDTENFTINVSNTNRPVTLDPIADVNVAEGASDTRTLVANDPDGDAISYSASLPAFASLAGNVITVSPGFTDAGSYPASATATAGLTSDTENFTINVSNTNRAVALDPIADLPVAEGASATRNVSASDADGDAISLSASLPAFASLTDNGDGTGSVTASPALGTALGAYPASVTASSADLTTDTENFSIIVSDVDIPVALDPIADINVAEGAAASTPVNATDGDGEMITLTASLPAFASLDAPTSGAGAVATTVTASPGFSDAGSYPASVTASAGPATDTELHDQRQQHEPSGDPGPDRRRQRGGRCFGRPRRSWPTIRTATRSAARRCCRRSLR